LEETHINDEVPGSEYGAREIEEIRKDLNAGLHHLHFMSMQTKHDLIDVMSRLSALVEVLIANGEFDFRDFDERRLRIASREQQRLAKRAHVQVADPEDKYAITDLPRIDCLSRLDLCKARCCTFNFPLSFQDLDEGIVKWNYSVPYMIRKNEKGYCYHCGENNRLCTIYNNRPAVCRHYDCRNDKNIWIDFDKGIPAPAGD
jgi:hypothetical protein